MDATPEQSRALFAPASCLGGGFLPRSGLETDRVRDGDVDDPVIFDDSGWLPHQAQRTSHDAFARSRGFERAIVYGGLMLAQLSFVLGSRIPGDHGVSTRWTIDYRRALYVGEAAVLRLEVTDVSPATGIIETKFSIRASERLIATGKTQSLVPAEDLTPP